MTNKTDQFSPQAAQQEWQILHNNHEQYEHYALIIKLVAIGLSVVLLINHVTLLIAISLLATLWLQEGIWKTYQNRLAKHLILLEQQLIPQATQLTSPPISNFQLYSRWQANSGGTITLLTEYLTNALRPTIAYPYVILISITLYQDIIY